MTQIMLETFNVRAGAVDISGNDVLRTIVHTRRLRFASYLPAVTFGWS